MSKILTLLTALLFAVVLAPGESRAVPVTVDAGWVDGTVSSPTDSINFTFTLSTAGVFSLTDCCNLGDTWSITGDIVGASTVGLASVSVPLGIGAFTSFFDPAWVNPLASHFQIALAAGTYSIFVSGDLGGGTPASFGVRVDTSAVPLPGAAILLLTGLGAIGGLSLRRRKAA